MWLSRSIHRRRAGPRAAERGELAAFELSETSQNGEDGVIAEILRRLGVEGGFFVEFGAATGAQCNCARLAAAPRWHGLMIEAEAERFGQLRARYADAPRIETLAATVTPTNVSSLFTSAGVPERFGVLSIDIDGNDYWVWRALATYRPQLVVIEYNAALPSDELLTIPQDEAWAWDETDYFGASIGALVHLAHARGYRLVHTDTRGVNAFFVETSAGASFGPESKVPRHPPNYFGSGVRLPRDPRRRQFLDLATGRLRHVERR